MPAPEELQRLERTLELLCAIRGHEVVLVKMETLRELRAALSALAEQAAEHEREADRLRAEGCGLCNDRNIEPAWRDEHGDKGPHWHHCIDPGDGLASDCGLSDRYEESFQEIHAEHERALAQARAEVMQEVWEIVLHVRTHSEVFREVSKLRARAAELRGKP